MSVELQRRRFTVDVDAGVVEVYAEPSGGRYHVAERAQARARLGPSLPSGANE